MKMAGAFVLCLVVVSGCSSSPKGIGIKGGKHYNVVGFVKKDVFRIKAIGFASSRHSSRKIRKQLAVTSAKMMAEFGTLEYFAEREEGNKYRNLKAFKNDEGIVKGWIRGGDVVSRKYDDEDNCTIIYEIKLVPKRR